MTQKSRPMPRVGRIRPATRRFLAVTPPIRSDPRSDPLRAGSRAWRGRPRAGTAAGHDVSWHRRRLAHACMRGPCSTAVSEGCGRGLCPSAVAEGRVRGRRFAWRPSPGYPGHRDGRRLGSRPCRGLAMSGGAGRA